MELQSKEPSKIHEEQVNYHTKQLLKAKKKKKILEVTIIEMEIQRSPMKWEKSLEKMTLVGT